MLSAQQPSPRRLARSAVMSQRQMAAAGQRQLGAVSRRMKLFTRLPASSAVAVAAASNVYIYHVPRRTAKVIASSRRRPPQLELRH